MQKSIAVATILFTIAIPSRDLSNVEFSRHRPLSQALHMRPMTWSPSSRTNNSIIHRQSQWTLDGIEFRSTGTVPCTHHERLQVLSENQITGYPDGLTRNISTSKPKWMRKPPPLYRKLKAAESSRQWHAFMLPESLDERFSMKVPRGETRTSGLQPGRCERRSETEGVCPRRHRLIFHGSGQAHSTWKSGRKSCYKFVRHGRSHHHRQNRAYRALRIDLTWSHRTTSQIPVHPSSPLCRSS